MPLSAASKRAEKIQKHGEEWFCGFTYTPVTGLGPEIGIHRRDPSSVLKVGKYYYVWYTKSCGPHFGRRVTDTQTKRFPWDYADIYYATSEDGFNWKEQGCAVPRGGKGEYDERTVCTPDCMEYNGKYYLVYQAMPQGEYTGHDENVAMAVADSPDGPWVKTGVNLLSPREPGRWFENAEPGSYNDADFIGRVHDPMLLAYRGKFYLYYKCASNSQRLDSNGHDTRWGVAIADEITGPYVPSPWNPVTNSGHETMLWKYKGGIAALLNRDGPEKNTIQYAEDGVNFELMSRVDGPTPQAGGAFRCDCTDEGPLEGVRWGLCHIDERGSDWNHIVRFDIDRRKNPWNFSWSYTYGKSREID